MALRELLAVFGIKVDDGELKKADDRLEGFVEKAQNYAKLLTGGLIAGFAGEQVKRLEEYGDELDKAAIRVGLTTDSLQQMGFAAGQSGSSVEGLTFALLQLEDRAGDAAQNAGGENAKAFAKLGISIKDASGHAKAADVLLEEVAEKLAGMHDQTQRVTTAVNLFGRGGRELIPLLENGAGGIERLRREAEELGGGFSKDAVKASTEFHESLERLNFVSISLRGKLAEVLLPVLRAVVDGATKVGGELLSMVKKSSLVETVLGALGIALGLLAVKMVIAFAPMLAAVAGVALLVLLVEDLVTLFRGGKSVVGEFIDAMFGMGAAEKFVRSVRDSFAGVVRYIHDAASGLRVLRAYLSGDFSLKSVSKEDLKGFANIANQYGVPGAQGLLDDLSSDPAATLRKQRREARKNGQVFIAPGETFAQAQAASIEADTAGPFAPPPSIAASGSSASVQISSPVNIHVAGSVDQNTKTEILREVDLHLDRRNRAAYDALVKHAEPAE